MARAAQLTESDTSVGMVASQVTFAHDPAKLDSAGIEVDALGVAWNRISGCLPAMMVADPSRCLVRQDLQPSCGDVW